MYKKFLNLLLCIGLLMQSFLFAIPVMAEEIKDIDIIINGIYQDDVMAELDDDGNYLIDKYGEVILDLSLKNSNNNEDYYVQINTDNSSYSSKYYKRHELQINGDKEVQNFEIKIFDTWDCQNLLATKTINIKLDYFNEIKDSYILISDIKQGGVDLIGEEVATDYRKVTLNNKQNIEFKITGMNLIDDVEYGVSIMGMYSKYKGSELEKGLNLVNYTNIEQNSHFWVDTFIEGVRIHIPSKYSDGVTTYDNFNIELNNDIYYLNYDSKLIYTNYPDVEIKKSDVEYKNYYVVDSAYHNQNNSLSYFVKVESCLDIDYNLSVEVKKRDSIIYKKDEKVHGHRLTEGHNIILDNFVMELNEDEGFDAELYSFYISLDDVYTKNEFKYNSIGEDVAISSNIFFENGKKNLSVFRGIGNSFFISGIFDTNKDVFNKFSSIYLRYIGENFKPNDTYDYVLEYGYYNDNSEMYDVRYENVLEKGKIDGNTFNTTGILFNVNNYKNYKNPTYKLTIKKGNEVLFSDSPVLYIVNSPTLANASLKANNKNLHLQTSDLSYVATRNAPIDMVISGLGFDNNTDYKFNYCYNKNYADGLLNENNQKCQTIMINGKDLNDGTAKITFDEVIDRNAISYDFFVIGEVENIYNENVAVQGGFTVTFVDSKDLFPTIKKYIIDNDGDLIKNISKNTSVDDFASNIDVVNNGSVKIYDTTGTTEITDNVGTGMIARVVNEYDEGVLDLDVVVKGDVSGDGNISVTDLVKVKRHLSEEEELTGVYEIAGNVTDTKEIGITDLVKIARDVAEIEEVK